MFFLRVIKVFFRQVFYKTNSSLFHKSKPVYETDGLITSHTFGGYNNLIDGDVNFQKALAVGRKEFVHILYHEWRLYVASTVIKMLMQRSNINYIELGVGEGHTLFVYSQYIKNLNNKRINKNFYSSSFFLMDTFKGIDLSLVSQKIIKTLDESALSSYGGTSGSLESIKDRFNFLGKKLKIIPGTIPSTLSELKIKFHRPIFIHIDLNNAVPEVESLKFFLPKMKSGDIILFDDYGFANAKEQRVLINKFFDNNRLSRPLTLPTGQGIYLF